MTILTPAHPTSTRAARVVSVARLNVANPWSALILPWIFLIGILLLNIGIWALITAAAGPVDYGSSQFQWSGSVFFIYIYMLIAAMQIIGVTFPFALGYGVTRRNFFLGSSVTFVGVSLMYAIGMTVLALIERATQGWGLGGHMFTAVYFGTTDPWYAQLWVFFCGLLLAFFGGSVFAAVWVRWKTFGIIAALLILGVILLGIGAIAVYTGSEDAIATAVIALGPVGLASWSLVLSAVSGLLGYLLLRRATPRG